MAKDARHKVRVTKAASRALQNDIRQYMDTGAYLSWSDKDRKYVLLGSNVPRGGLVDCPECGVGRLMVVRSRTTGKRFVGCSNYLNGCTASAPLLQKARLRATKKACEECGWPEVIFRYSIRQKWTRQCSNMHCSTRNGSPTKAKPKTKTKAKPKTKTKAKPKTKTKTKPKTKTKAKPKTKAKAKKDNSA